MTTNNFTHSSLPRMYNLVQNTMTLFPKELVIATMRDFFSKDDYYHFTTDPWGYPKTPDHTDLPRNAGFKDNLTTRLFIGENYRFDVVYYPAIIVRSGGSNSVPISLNRDTSTVKWEFITFEDGYGNLKKYRYPKSFVFAGAWEGSINIDIITKDLRSRDDLVDLVSILFTDIAYEDMVKAGVAVKNVSSSAPTETDDRNDKLFRQSITLQVRSEWRRHIPVGNIIEVIASSLEFGTIDPEGPIAPNLTIHNSESLADIIASL